MADLLSRDLDPTGIMSLLTPFVTGGAIAPPAPGAADPQAQAAAGAAAVPAWLAFARTMGQSAMPHYGPPTPLGPALADAMSAGYGTAVQAEQLPLLRQSLAMSLQQRELALQQQQFEFGREQAMWKAFGGLLLPGSAGSGVPSGGGVPGVPGVPGGSGAPGGSGGSGASLQATTSPNANNVGNIKAPGGGYVSYQTPQDGVTGIVSTLASYGPPGALTFNQAIPKYVGRPLGSTPPPGLISADDYATTVANAAGLKPDDPIPFGDPGKMAQITRRMATIEKGQGAIAGMPDQVFQQGVAGGPGGGGGAQAPGGAMLGPVVQTPFGPVPQTVYQDARLAGAAAAANGDVSAGIQTMISKIQDWQKSQRVQTAPGVQVNPYTGEQSPSTVSPTTEPMSPADRATYFPNAPSNVGAYWEIDATGKRTPELAGGARGSQQLYQRITDQNNSVMNSAPMKQLQTAETYSRGVVNGLNANNRAGDIAAIESLFKVYDPGATATEGKWEIASNIGGYQGQLQDWWSRLQNGTLSALTPANRQQIADLMTAEMKSREGQVGNYITMARGNYAGDAGEAAGIGRGWRPQYIAPGDDEAADLPAGTAPSTMGWIGTPGAGGVVRWRRQPLGAAAPGMPATPPQAAPPAAPPTTTATPAPSSVVPSAAAATPPRAQAPQQMPNRLTPGALPKDWKGLAALGADIQANPGKYSDADRQAYTDAVAAAAHAGAAGGRR